MKLPVPAFFNKLHKNEKQNYYLALLLRDEKAVALVLEEQDGQMKLRGKAEEAITEPIENIPHEDLLAILDKTISQAEETLPPQIQTEKTVLGIKETWVEEKKIKKEYLAKLKKVCDALSLSPIGFMVISEAIAHMLQQEEGAPLSAVLAEIGKKNVTLSLFRAGKLIESHHGTIDGPLPQTVDKLLHHFTTTVLPSRIILFNGGSDDLGQDFIAHQWSPGLPFLHVPQIAVLPREFDGKAMIVGVAEQLGFSVTESLGDTTVHELGNSHKKQKGATEESMDQLEEEDPERKNTKDEESDTPPDGEKSTDTATADSAAAEFGFMVGDDIAKATPSPREMDDIEKNSSSIKEKAHFASEHQNLRIPDEESFHRSNSLAQDEERKHTFPFTFLGSLPIAGMLSKLSSLPSRIAKMLPKGLPLIPGGNRLMLAVPVILLLLGGVLYLYLFQIKATITLSIQPQVVRETEAVTLAAGKQNNFDKGTLAARTIEIAVEGEETTQATGKKEVGEKAKGSVTLFNSSESRRTISKGTTLTASNDREFITEEDVTVASASGDIFSGIKSGTAKVNVVAKEIGQEYNMPSNTKFTISGSTTLAGKNEAAFSGGSKRTITVVSQQDMKNLSENLPQKLEEQAKKQLASKIQTGESVLGIFTDVSTDEENTSAKVGEEAKEVTMKATVTYTTLSYKEQDIIELAKNTLLSNNAKDLLLSEKSLKTSMEDMEVESENEVSTSLEMEGGLLPKVEQEQITQKLQGKSFSEAQDYLAGLPQVKTATIQLKPNLPFLPKFLPRKAANITVEVVSNG